MTRGRHTNRQCRAHTLAALSDGYLILGAVCAAAGAAVSIDLGAVDRARAVVSEECGGIRDLFGSDLRVEAATVVAKVDSWRSQKACKESALAV